MADNPTMQTNLPAEYQDILAGQFLQVPDIEFIWTRFFYAASLADQFRNEDGWDLAMMQLKEGRLTSPGDPSNILDAMANGMGRDLLANGIVYPEMVNMVREAKGPNETIKINRPRYINGATTEASRRLASSARIFGSNSQPINTDQVSITVREYGGPGDSNGNVVPISLASFGMNRAVHDLLVQTGAELRRDRNKFVDDMAYRLITAACPSANVIRGGSATADNAFVGSGNEPMSLDLLFRASEPLKSVGFAGIGGQMKYLAILDVRQMTQLKIDPQYQRLAVFEPQWNPLFPGYVKTVEDLIICVTNSTTMRVTNLGAGSNVSGYNGIVVAPGVIGWASGMDARVLRDRNDDGGRFNAFAWNAYEGFGILDERAIVKITTT